ncbi:hypothetical protein O181_010489 [Austropuccinia psidii MF-1]|uniref:Uncharacterized protein n=1 Tax=Austropuccinia psidii MF-1 TaxID=1389203 RepID=A0A9Q3BR61_9BASI|nr:hypothetical protein [Austropuccinia psidii MF-1]
MEEGVHVSLYIAYSRSLVSRIDDWGEKAYINHFRKELASHSSTVYSLQDFIDVTLELNTRYHERKKEKNHSQEKNTEASKSSSLNSQNSSSSWHNMKKKSNFKKRDKSHYSLLNKDHKSMGSEKE